ncbi:MAG TPA: hypothetical protein V6D34_18100 [Candidatus Sericytochromatia bacterium]
MTWKPGRTVRCDQAGRGIVDSIVQIELNRSVISCALINTVVCGQQQHL